MRVLHQTRRVCSAAFVIVAAVSFAACDVMISQMDGGFGGGRVKAEQSYAKTFKLEGAGASFELVNTNGAISVLAVDGTTVDVKATITARADTEEAAKELLKKVEIKEDASPGRLKLDATRPGRRQPIEVRFVLLVPRHVKINLQNANGAIDITGMQASVRAETSNGGVKGRGLGGSLEASTTNGGMDIQMAVLGPDGVTLDTTNGGIELRLPADARATLAARSVNGGITVTDLPFEKDARSNRRRVDGTINGGGVPLKLETVNGGVRVGKIGGAGAVGPKTGAREKGKVSAGLDRH
jgi:DUF4097 and DUF4098 domain-containing protein YvlB